MSWVDGRQLTGALLTTDDPDDLGRQFGALLRQVHALPLPEGATATIPWRHVLPPDLLAALQREPVDAPVVLHLDYHPNNVMERDGRIVAVLDWANADTGDPRYDLARTTAILAHAPLPDPGVAPGMAAFSAGMRAELGQPAVPPCFFWWAGVTMAADLQPKLGHPALPWLDDDWLRRLRAWTDAAREQTSRR
jgi:hypothetical protein